MNKFFERFRAITPLFGFSLIFLSGGLANAEPSPELQEFRSPRVISLAGTGRGFPILTDTIHQNIAALGFQEVQALQGSYNWQNFSPRVPSVREKIWNGSIVDGRNEYAVAGISFTRRSDVDVYHLGVAKKLTDFLSIGGTAKRYSTRAAYEKYIGSRSGYDGGISVSANLTKLDILPVGMQVGATLDNLVRRGSDEAIMGGRKLGVAARTDLKGIVSIYTDYVRVMGNTTETYSYFGAGAEVSLGADFFIRGGGFGFQRTGWGAGGGWMGPKIGVNYGYQKKLKPHDGFEHAVGFDFYM